MCNAIFESNVPEGVTHTCNKDKYSKCTVMTKRNPSENTDWWYVAPRREKEHTGEFVVIQGGNTAILGAGSGSSTTDQVVIFGTYSTVFDVKLSTFPGRLHLEADPAVKSTQLPLCKIPIAMKPLLRKSYNIWSNWTFVENRET